MNLLFSEKFQIKVFLTGTLLRILPIKKEMVHWQETKTWTSTTNRIKVWHQISASTFTSALKNYQEKHNKITETINLQCHNSHSLQSCGPVARLKFCKWYLQLVGIPKTWSLSNQSTHTGRTERNVKCSVCKNYNT